LNRYELNGLVFEWDDDKERGNIEKHGFGFELAAEAFFDTKLLYLDSFFIEGEERIHLLGEIRGVHLLFVAHAERSQDNETSIRIISARRATANERAKYYAQLR